mmetsp:Transcript_72529/g.208163  ORF Transcript_72529/g.208163 Transcript_72529/m.208163 type:complete len:211 (-) Transcript_72529:4-636(-)
MPLEGQGEVEVRPGVEGIQSPTVVRLQPSHKHVRALESLFLLLLVYEHHEEQKHREGLHLDRVWLRQLRELDLDKLLLLLVGHRGVGDGGHGQVLRLSRPGGVDGLLQQGPEHVRRHRSPERGVRADHAAHDPVLALLHGHVDRLHVLRDALEEEGPGIFRRLLLLLLLLTLLFLAILGLRVLHPDVLLLFRHCRSSNLQGVHAGSLELD